MTTPLSATSKKSQSYARQIAFCAAFVLPLGKLLEVPSLLAGFAKGDILLPALIQLLIQSLILLAALYASSKSSKTLLERMEDTFGGWIRVFFILYILYFLLASVLPLLDLEKFVYAAYFDTAPTTFSFGLFFILLAFVCAKGLKSFARLADLSLFLFLIPFFALVVMALFEADFTHLLPLFGAPFDKVSQGITYTTPHFCDVALLLPFLVTHRYKKGDGVKITAGYFGGGLITLLFFGVFFGVFSSLSPREHYAFAKIAQYFPALETVGRIDLVFVYLLSTVLLFYTALPLLHATESAARLFKTERKALLSAAVCIAAFFFVLFANRFYNLFYGIVSGKLYPVFWVIGCLLPIGLLALPTQKKERLTSKENPHAQ